MLLPERAGEPAGERVHSVWHRRLHVGAPGARGAASDSPGLRRAVSAIAASVQFVIKGEVGVGAGGQEEELSSLAVSLGLVIKIDKVEGGQDGEAAEGGAARPIGGQEGAAYPRWCWCWWPGLPSPTGWPACKSPWTTTTGGSSKVSRYLIPGIGSTHTCSSQGTAPSPAGVPACQYQGRKSSTAIITGSSNLLHP